MNKSEYLIGFCCSIQTFFSLDIKDCQPQICKCNCHYHLILISVFALFFIQLLCFRLCFHVICGVTLCSRSYFLHFPACFLFPSALFAVFIMRFVVKNDRMKCYLTFLWLTRVYAGQAANPPVRPVSKDKRQQITY